MRAKYAGRCRACGVTIKPGDEIERLDFGWGCPPCSEAERRERRERIEAAREAMIEAGRVALERDRAAGGPISHAALQAVGADGLDAWTVWVYFPAPSGYPYFGFRVEALTFLSIEAARDAAKEAVKTGGAKKAGIWKSCGEGSERNRRSVVFLETYTRKGGRREAA